MSEYANYRARAMKGAQVDICYVYLICSEIDGKPHGPCKVGISNDPDKRLKQVQTGSPNKLVVAITFAIWDRKLAQTIEASFHAGHCDYRMNGEWFDLDVVDTLRGLVEVIKMGLDHLLAAHPDPAVSFDAIAEACGLMEGARLLHAIYEQQGLLTTQQPKAALN